MRNSITQRAFPPGIPLEQCLKLARDSSTDGSKSTTGRDKNSPSKRPPVNWSPSGRQAESSLGAAYDRLQWKFPSTRQISEHSEEAVDAVIRSKPAISTVTVRFQAAQVPPVELS